MDTDITADDLASAPSFFYGGWSTATDDEADLVIEKRCTIYDNRLPYPDDRYKAYRALWPNACSWAPGGPHSTDDLYMAACLHVKGVSKKTIKNELDRKRRRQAMIEALSAHHAPNNTFRGDRSKAFVTDHGTLDHESKSEVTRNHVQRPKRIVAPSDLQFTIVRPPPPIESVQEKAKEQQLKVTDKGLGQAASIRSGSNSLPWDVMPRSPFATADQPRSPTKTTKHLTMSTSNKSHTRSNPPSTSINRPNAASPALSRSPAAKATPLSSKPLARAASSANLNDRSRQHASRKPSQDGVKRTKGFSMFKRAN